MLKHFFVISAVCFFLMPAFAAYGDVIEVPEKRHANKIVYLGRSFTANGKGGGVAVKKEPGSKICTAIVQNGKVTYIQHSCLYDKIFWGFTPEHHGWIKLDEMLVQYDYVAFEEDHRSEFYPYSGDVTEIKETRSAVAWPWPGSGAYLWTYEDLDMNSFRIAHAYKDKEGREWGFAPYLHSGRNIWFCLSDPLNRDIPAFNPAPEPGVWKSETAHVDIKQFKDPAITLIIMLVAALVVCTLVLINMFWKPNIETPIKCCAVPPDDCTTAVMSPDGTAQHLIGG